MKLDDRCLLNGPLTCRLSSSDWVCRKWIYTTIMDL